MIEVAATLSIVAKDDTEADAVYATIHEALKTRGLHATWPETPIVNMIETRREVVR